MNTNLSNLYLKSPRFIQTIGINSYELFEWRIRNSKIFQNKLKFLKKSEKWDIDEIKEYQIKQFRYMIKYAYDNVPYYHNLYKKKSIDLSKIKNIDDLKKIPIIKKIDIINNWEEFISKNRNPYVSRETSGTTGIPLSIKISKDLNLLEKANWMRRDIWAGFNNDRIARFVGDTPIINCNQSRLFRQSYVLNRLLFPSYCLSKQSLPKIIDILKKKKVTIIQCYPSTGYLIAKFLEHNEEYLPLKSVLYSSEPLYDFQRKIIEERFQAQSFGYYGQAEELTSAIECNEKEYHLTSIDGIMEIIDHSGETIEDGEKGFTICSSLHNYSMPLIRYALNDYTGIKTEKCHCGRTLPLIFPVETKMEDFIVNPEGRIISPSLLTFPLKEMKNIIETQIIQKSMDNIIVKLVTLEKFNQQDEKKFLEMLIGIIGKEMNISIEYVDKIFHTKNYKKRFVINEINNYLGDIFE